MTWRVARSLIQLREQVNAKFPERSKASDGTIGNAEHASHTSDHNPWVKDGDMGIVTGMDITHDPLHGLDSEHLAEALRTSKDPRLKYVISNKKIAAFDHGDFMWRPYHGVNAHNHHCHISVKPEKALYDDVKPWNFDHVVPASSAPLEKPHPIPRALIRHGDTGPAVKELQMKLHIDPADGTFGPATETAVKEFQQAHGLVPDGKVGPYTWEKL
jgi:Putative peptidoglycan binding domain